MGNPLLINMDCTIEKLTQGMTEMSSAYKYKADQHKAQLRQLKDISKATRHLFISETRFKEVHKFRVQSCILLALFTHLLVVQGVVSVAIGASLGAICILGTVAWLLCERADRDAHSEKVYALIRAYPAKDTEAKLRLIKMYKHPNVIQPDDFTDWLNIEMMSLMLN